MISQQKLIGIRNSLDWF